MHSWADPTEADQTIAFTATPLDAEYQWTVVTSVTPLEITSAVQ